MRSCFVARMRTNFTFLLLGAGLLVACPSPASTDGQKAAQTTAPVSQPASAPASQASSAPAGPAAEPVTGLIKLADGVTASAVKPTDVLFIMARESQGGGKAGRLVAVQRHGQIEFPKRYELSSKDAMMPGIPFKGPFVIYARLDRDGDPMTKGAEDLYGAVNGEVTSGQQDVHIVLNKKPASQPAR